MGNRAWDMITVRNQMQDALEPQYADFQGKYIDPLSSLFSNYGTQITDQMKSAMGDYDTALAGYDAVTGDYNSAMGNFDDILGSLGSVMGGYDSYLSDTVAPLKNKMMAMMNDESQRGYSEDVQNAMYSKQADALSGAKASYIKNMGKNLASQGLGGAASGSRNRMLNEYERNQAGNLRAASRDVKLADAEAKRADLWNAVQGYGQAAGLEAQGLAGKTGAASAMTGAASGKTGAASGKAGLAAGKAGTIANKANTGANYMGLGLDNLSKQGTVSQLAMQNLQNQLGYWGEKAGQSQAYSGVKNSESGFWKSFKNSLGNALGGGLGNTVTGFM